jgi:hypothetical protein
MNSTKNALKIGSRQGACRELRASLRRHLEDDLARHRLRLALDFSGNGRQGSRSRSRPGSFPSATTSARSSSTGSTASESGHEGSRDPFVPLGAVLVSAIVIFRRYLSLMLETTIALIIGFALGYGVREWVLRRYRRAEQRRRRPF